MMEERHCYECRFGGPSLNPATNEMCNTCMDFSKWQTAEIRYAVIVSDDPSVCITAKSEGEALTIASKLLDENAERDIYVLKARNHIHFGLIIDEL